MQRANGYSIIIDPETQQIERDTMTCAHCQKVTHLIPFKPLAAQGGYCPKCDKLVCSGCAGKPCYPAEKMIEDWERIGNSIIAGHR